LLALVAALLLPLQVFAEAPATHHHYKLIDLGTFGGPHSQTIQDWSGPAHNLNNQGTFVGWADTSQSDPYQNSSSPPAGDWCFNGDCYVSHAFTWQNGIRTDPVRCPMA